MTKIDFVKAYGEPKESMLIELTQSVIATYHRLGVDEIELVGGFGVDWLQLLLTYNEEIEEYELCAVFRDLINNYKNQRNEKSNI